jgi:predicted metal-binding membrane protein
VTRSSEQILHLSSAALFTLSAIVTLYFIHAMSSGMQMAGGWTMSMMWMRMPGQGWLSTSLVFATMWLSMMVAMMLPSALPMLLIYQKTARFRGEEHVGLATWCLGAGYFGVWLVFGLIAYALGVGIAHAAMASEIASRAIPVACGASLIVAGVYQLTPLKAACLKHCRDPLRLIAGHLGNGWRGALTLGVHHGAFCAACCWSLMLMQLVLGVMNLAAMVIIAAVIAAEKLLPRGVQIARGTGILSIAAGAALTVQAL